MKGIWIGLASLCLLFVGCGGSDNPASSNSEVAGNYAIQRAEVIFPDFTIDVTPPELTGALLLGVDGEYVMTATSTGGEVEISNTGTYTFANNAFMFDNPGISSTHSGNQITLRLTGASGSIVLVYER